LNEWKTRDPHEIDKAELDHFRAVCYGFSTLLQFFRLEADLQIESELAEIRHWIADQATPENQQITDGRSPFEEAVS
jgi:hypothetical protein